MRQRRMRKMTKNLTKEVSCLKSKIEWLEDRLKFLVENNRELRDELSIKQLHEAEEWAEAQWNNHKHGA
jgi:hypothetical protein